MRYTGVVKRIDDLGRLVIPREIRRTMRIHDGDAFEIVIHEDMVCFKKYNPSAHLADNAVDLQTDIDEVINEYGLSLESQQLLNDAKQLLQQVYQNIRTVERKEQERL